MAVTQEFVQLGILLVILALLTPVLGEYMARVFQGQRVFLSPVVRPVERGFYKIGGIHEDREQHWMGYLVAVILFSVVGLLISYALMRLQSHLPLNPDNQPPVPGYLSFNTAVSFTTNTNWQSYGGETTMSYLSQMLALATHNFMSAATAMAIAVAVIRGFARHSVSEIGNFWVDMTRATLYVLLPICVVAALLFVAQGIPQTLSGAVTAHTLDGATQMIARGPVASQEAIKMLGTNGGGFFNTNSAHPFENPTPFTNLIEMVFAAWIAFAFTWTFGRMVGSMRQGFAVAGAMVFILVLGIAIAGTAEKVGNPAFTKLGVDQTTSGSAPGGNMEGKEVRFGPVNTGAFNVFMTDTSAGAVNGFSDSFTPLGGMVPLVNMKLGSIAPGGVGSGLYGILMFAVLSVFIAGLMVGRTPEYLGKKLQAYEVRMAALAVLLTPVIVLGFAGVASVIPKGTSAILNSGPHGLTEMVYAFSSANVNNGSAFAGLSTNTNFYNITLSIAMFAGRFIFVVPILALAGAVARKPKIPVTVGTFPTDTALFTGLLIGVIVIIGALTFFPALALGPLAEHLRMITGQLSS